MLFNRATIHPTMAGGRRSLRTLLLLLLAASLVGFGALHDMFSPPQQPGANLLHLKHYPAQPININRLFTPG